MYLICAICHWYIGNISTQSPESDWNLFFLVNIYKTLFQEKLSCSFVQQTLTVAAIWYAVNLQVRYACVHLVFLPDWMEAVVSLLLWNFLAVFCKKWWESERENYMSLCPYACIYAHMLLQHMKLHLCRYLDIYFSLSSTQLVWTFLKFIMPL